LLYILRIHELTEQRKEMEDENGIIYDMHEKLREILSVYNNTVAGRCSICLEDFCQD
jgi:hypothetical protein